VSAVLTDIGDDSVGGHVGHHHSTLDGSTDSTLKGDDTYQWRPPSLVEYINWFPYAAAVVDENAEMKLAPALASAHGPNQ
jgi:hypothetical protein